MKIRELSRDIRGISGQQVAYSRRIWPSDLARDLHVWVCSPNGI